MKNKEYIQMMGKQLLFGHFKTGFFLIIISTSILGFISTSAYATRRDFAQGSRSDRRPFVEVSHASHPVSQMMTFKEGKFTARIYSTPLRMVMEEFSRLSGVNVSWTGPETEDLISIRFANLSPDRAVEKILDGQSYLLFYNAIENGDKLTRVKIISVTSESATRCGRGAGVPTGTYRIWTREQVRFLKRAYRRFSLDELVVEFNKKFDTKRTRQQIRCFLHNHHVQSGRTGYFEQGHKPWNAGTKGQGLTGRNRTSFMKGHAPKNRKPLGSERVCPKDGYILVKVAEKNPYNGQPTRYRPKHVVAWEQAHGPVPEGSIVSFLDGDRKNCAIENLTLITRTENLFLNQNGYGELPVELKPAMRAVAKLKVKTYELTRPQGSAADPRSVLPAKS